jgi:hypothetical protein
LPLEEPTQLGKDLVGMYKAMRKVAAVKKLNGMQPEALRSDLRMRSYRETDSGSKLLQR